VNLALAIVRDLLSDETEWWDGELETITGFERANYLTLLSRLAAPEMRVSPSDKLMLHQAANNLLAYPGISTRHVSGYLGPSWQAQVREFMALMKGDK
jgi:hypothetical protein